jgi:hypothetical protein
MEKPLRGELLTACVHSSVVHSSDGDSFYLQGHDEQANAAMLWSSSPHCSCAVVTPDAIRDPLLRPIDYPMISLPRRRSLYVCNITASLWFRDAKTEPQLSSSYTRQPLLALLFCPESSNGRTPNTVSTPKTPSHTAPAHAVHFIRNYHAAPCVPFFVRNSIRKLYATGVGRVLDRVGDCEAALAMSKADFFRDLASSFPFLGVWQELRGDVVSTVCTEVVM